MQLPAPQVAAPDCQLNWQALKAMGALPTTGELRVTAGPTSPGDLWLAADGSVVAIDDYPVLYREIGTTHNTGGEGAGNFRLPNAEDRVILGAGGTYALGATGGAATHTLTTGEMPAHTHPPLAPMDAFWQADNAVGAVVQGGATYVGNNLVATTGSTGGDEAHNNLQPYIALNVWVFAG